jgi:hypothetical protein
MATKVIGMSDDKSLQSQDDYGFQAPPGDLVQKTQARLRSWLKKVMCKPARGERELSLNFDKLATNHFSRACSV